MNLTLRGAMVWGGAAAIVAAFYLADIFYGCTFFQRGGAALAMYAVFIGAFSVAAWADYANELQDIQQDQCEIAQAMYAEDHEARPDQQVRLRRQIEPKLKELDGRLDRLANARRLFQGLQLVEGPILIFGTLIWGFGDLLVRTAGCAV